MLRALRRRRLLTAATAIFRWRFVTGSVAWLSCSLTSSRSKQAVAPSSSTAESPVGRSPQGVDWADSSPVPTAGRPLQMRPHCGRKNGVLPGETCARGSNFTTPARVARLPALSRPQDLRSRPSVAGRNAGSGQRAPIGLPHLPGPENFYTRLLQGQRAPAALADSERALRSNPSTAHPYYWAAFTSFGS